MRPYDDGYRALKAVIDSGQIGEPLMLHCAHRNPTVGENYKTDMAITDTLIHKNWMCCGGCSTMTTSRCKWCFRANQQGARPSARPADRAVGDRQGTRIDVEVFVNCRCGYDIGAEVVGETGIAKLPEPSRVQLRSGASCPTQSDGLEESVYRRIRRGVAGVHRQRACGTGRWTVGVGWLCGGGGGGCVY